MSNSLQNIVKNIADVVFYFALLSLVLTIGDINDTNAKKAKGISGKVSPKSFDSSTKKIVCGDCSELEENSIPESIEPQS